MKKHGNSLPPGWFPENKEGIENLVAKWQASGKKPREKAISCIAPHAGWAFSGKLAWEAISSLDSSAETVIIFGGHLGAEYPPLLVSIDSYITPHGELYLDGELLNALSDAGKVMEKDIIDNTIDVLLPLVALFFPNARIVCARMPEKMESFEFGKKAIKTCAELGRKAVAIGSTDLTHYGPNYGFEPMGAGIEAERWVREENDSGIIRALVGKEPKQAISAAVEKRAACSVGAAIAAMGFSGDSKGNLLDYATSLDADIFSGRTESSFVGYCAIAYSK